MSKFAERLKELREEKGLSMVELGKLTGFTHNSISRWESKIHIPNADTIVIFADFFQVTADYLLGREN